MSEKFNSLEDLIKNYYCLVEKHQNGLPPYATFSPYKDRPEKVQELVKKLSNKNNEIVLEAILELWASKKDSNFLHENLKRPNNPQLIHSITPRSNTLATFLKFKDNEIISEKAQKDKIVEFAGNLYKDIIRIKNENEIDWKKFKELLKAKKELAFWFYYNEDIVPIINKRAEQSKKILTISFPKDEIKSNDLEFNKQCMGYIGSKIVCPEDSNNMSEEGKTYITKQLMLDQLFYSIDEIKSMKKVDEQYKDDKENEIYKFYKKLWNTISDVKRIEQKGKELNLFKNIIYHGAPGTGKTFKLKEEVQDVLDLFHGGKSEFIQFHGAYYYEDFMGGLKPTIGTELSLEYKNGIFKELCKKAAKYEIRYYTSEDWQNEEKKDITFTLEEKEYKISKENPDFSQFPPFFIIIDEINRADLSKVFGELLYAIEDDYRGYKHKFKLSSSSMETEKTAICWENGEAYFFVPKNLYIRGTMNDIDKSVDSIDFAFRRRFKWVEKNYDANIIDEIILQHFNEDEPPKEILKKYKKACTALNKKILKDIDIADKSYEIGHAIFANIVKYVEKIEDINETKYKEELFDNHIEPILYNYLKMDYGNEAKNADKFRDEFVK